MKWLRVLALLVVLPAEAAVHKLDLNLMVQRQDSLCWAAVSAMASRAFTVPCQFRRPTQEDVVHSKFMDTHELPRRCPARRNCAAASSCEGDDPLKPGQDFCGADAANCNVTRPLWLLDVRSRKVGEFGLGNARELTAARIRHEIKNRDAPVLISWYYIDPEVLSEAQQLARLDPGQGLELINRSRGSGGHFLIITGYNDTTQEVRVWDPWPAQGVDEPDNHLRHKWIAYERYRDPKIDNGAPVNADHDADEFALCRCTAAQLESVASLQSAVQPVQPLQISMPADFDFAQGVPELLAEREQVMRARAVRSASGRKVGGELMTDAGFATVAITTKGLLRASQRPEILLAPRTSALVVPVMRKNRVVDSFLLVHSGNAWHEGGYSNNEIARRLTEFRAQRSSEGRFYLLAIPEQGKFFIARGFGASAELAVLDGNVQGRFLPAADALKRLAAEVERNRELRLGHSDQPVQ